MMHGSSAIAIALTLGLSLACSGVSDRGGDGTTPEVKVAFPEDFRGYHSWEAFDVTPDAALAGIHDGSTVTEYLNERPPTGSTEFPVGTIIVKEPTGGTETHPIFAMVKRGGGFNKNLPGWEWIEIENLDDGKDGVKFTWRGFGPPAGETYGGNADATCNSCHLDCNNDGVCAKPLNLSNF